MNTRHLSFLLTCCISIINLSCTKMDTKSSSYKVGNYEVYTLTEEESKGSVDILINASDSILNQYAPDRTFPKAVRAYLVKKGDEISLFDTGFGKHIFDEMNSIGISASDIQTIYLTHMHGDHIGGLLKDGEPTFPNAQIKLSQKEYDYWTSEEEMKLVPENKRANFASVKNVIEKYKNRLIIETPDSLQNGATKDGIYMYKAYGHTPGHVMYLVKDGDQELLIWGDILHVLNVQMPHPEISVSYDVDPLMARDSRLEVLDFVSKKSLPIAGMHIPYGGIGTVSKDEVGYSFTPTNLSK